jgi:hypothetical protein
MRSIRPLCRPDEYLSLPAKAVERLRWSNFGTDHVGKGESAAVHQSTGPELHLPALRARRKAREGSPRSAAVFVAYSGAGAMATVSWLGPIFGAGLAQRMSPRRLAAAVVALDSVMVMRS